MMTTSYELFSSLWRRHIRRLRKMSSTRGLACRRDQRVDADRAAAEALGRVGDRRPHVLAGRPAEQKQVAVLVLADEDPGLAADRPGSQRAEGRHGRAQVQRTE